MYFSQFNLLSLSLDLTVNFWFYVTFPNYHQDIHVYVIPSFIELLKNSTNYTLSYCITFCSKFPNIILLNLGLFESIHFSFFIFAILLFCGLLLPVTLNFLFHTFMSSFYTLISNPYKILNNKYLLSSLSFYFTYLPFVILNLFQMRYYVNLDQHFQTLKC